MRNLITLIIIILSSISACKTVQLTNKIDYDKIRNLAYVKCVATRAERFQNSGYEPTTKGWLSIKAGCYMTLKLAGVLK